MAPSMTRSPLGATVQPRNLPKPLDKLGPWDVSADAAYKALGDRADGTRAGVLMTLMPSVKKTSSKPAVNFASLSRTRNLTARGRSERSKFRFRACWVTKSRGWVGGHA